MSAVDVLLIVVGVGYVLARRLIGELVEIKGLLTVPVALTVVGAVQLRDALPVDAVAVVFVVASCALSVGIGVLRGQTVHLGERNGELWMRYRASTVGLWVLNLALKGAVLPIEQAVSPSATSAADHAILLSIGVGILAETAVVVLRAMRSTSVVVWEKGEDGLPHRSSPAFDRARAWVNEPRPVAVDATGVRTKVSALARRDW